MLSKFIIFLVTIKIDGFLLFVWRVIAFHHEKLFSDMTCPKRLFISDVFITWEWHFKSPFDLLPTTRYNCRLAPKDIFWTFITRFLGTPLKGVPNIQYEKTSNFLSSWGFFSFIELLPGPLFASSSIYKFWVLNSACCILMILNITCLCWNSTLIDIVCRKCR